MANGIGRTAGGRATKIHAVCDERGRPWSLVVTAGNVADISAAKQCIESLPPSRELLADKGYDADALRNLLAERGTIAVIPPMRHRRIQYPYDRATYNKRNMIERMFCRLKDWRRIATRYDRKIQTFLAAITIAAIVSWWIK